MSEEVKDSAFDLDAFNLKAAADAGFELQVLDPVHQLATPIWIRLLGRDSSAYQAKLREQQRRRTELLRRKGKAAVPDMEEMIAETIELLVVATIGWRVERLVSLNKQPFPEYSPAAARALYADDGFSWIRDQVDAAIADRANFTKASSAS